ncbi:unnamed protein product, partial [marine sediment metagenome]
SAGDYGDFLYYNINNPSDIITYNEFPDGDDTYQPISDPDGINYKNGTTIILPVYASSATWFARAFYYNFNNPTIREWVKRLAFVRLDSYGTNSIYMDGGSIPTNVVSDNGMTNGNALPYYEGATWQESTLAYSDLKISIYKAIKNQRPKTKMILNFFRDQTGFETINRDNLYLEDNQWCWDAWLCENRFYNDTFYDNIDLYRTWILNLKSIGKDFWFNASTYSSDFAEYDSDLSNSIWYWINLVA